MRNCRQPPTIHPPPHAWSGHWTGGGSSHSQVWCPWWGQSAWRRGRAVLHPSLTTGNIIDELICDIINEVIPKDAPVSIVREEFSCTDICYRPKTIRETAMSLFIFKYNFKLFTKINDVWKKHVTMDFKNKRDLFSFVTRENVEFVFYVKFPAISSTSELIRYEIKIIQLVHNLFL